MDNIIDENSRLFCGDEGIFIYNGNICKFFPQRNGFREQKVVNIVPTQTVSLDR